MALAAAQCRHSTQDSDDLLLRDATDAAVTQLRVSGVPGLPGLNPDFKFNVPCTEVIGYMLTVREFKRIVWMCSFFEFPTCSD